MENKTATGGTKSVVATIKSLAIILVFSVAIVFFLSWLDSDVVTITFKEQLVEFAVGTTITFVLLCIIILPIITMIKNRR